jgi:hypothetical protein
MNLEFFLFLIISWPVVGLIMVLIGYINDAGDYRNDTGNNVFMGLFLGYIMVPLVLGDVETATNERAKRKRNKLKREESNKKKRLEAEENYITLSMKLFNKIENFENMTPEIDKSFFLDILKLADYFKAFEINEIKNIEQLRRILIFARLNLNQYYETHELKGGDAARKKITSVLKKIK